MFRGWLVQSDNRLSASSQSSAPCITSGSSVPPQTLLRQVNLTRTTSQTELQRYVTVRLARVKLAVVVTTASRRVEAALRSPGYRATLAILPVASILCTARFARSCCALQLGSVLEHGSAKVSQKQQRETAIGT
ncbi:hypothetical protein J6590_062367 [Homalodisca vitripennis]|nr:hypothetical protein J6590_062367 [Homalodisca vitripennis]